MKIVATYDFVIDLGSGPEPVIRGQEFTPPGTGIMNRAEHAVSLIRQGAALTPEAFAKTKLRGDAMYAATRQMIEQGRA